MIAFKHRDILCSLTSKIHFKKTNIIERKVEIAEIVLYKIDLFLFLN